jgi:hypothetical protein
LHPSHDADGGRSSDLIVSMDDWSDEPYSLSTCLDEQEGHLTVFELSENERLTSNSTRHFAHRNA